MISQGSSTDNCSNHQSIWLIIHRETASRGFEFPAHIDRCLVVGSAPAVDLHLGGVAPIAFHLERDGGGIRLTPAYADAFLRVDAQRVVGARVIRGQAVIEVAGHRLYLQICDAPPAGVALEPAHSNPDPLKRRSSPPIDAASTTTELVAPTAVPALRAQATVLISPEQSRCPGAMPAAAVSFGATQVEIGRNVGETQSPAATQCIDAAPTPIEPLPIVDLARRVGSVLRSVEPQAPNPAQHTVAISAAEVAQFMSPRQPLVASDYRRGAEFSAPRFTPTPVPAHEMLPRKVPPEATDVEMPVVKLAVAKARMPVASKSPVVMPKSASRSSMARAPETSPLERLGILLKRYPVGVVGGSLVIAILIGVFLVGLGQLLGGQPAATQVAVNGQRAAQSPVASPSVSRVAIPSAEEPTPSPSSLSGATSQAVAGDSPQLSATPISDPSLVTAAGHLFAGRLPEAEHAYRELSQRYPQDGTFATVARILSRRNSPDCRPGNPQQRACPTVKP